VWIVLDRCFPLQEIVAASKYHESRQHVGKVDLELQDLRCRLLNAAAGKTWLRAVVHLPRLSASNAPVTMSEIIFETERLIGRRLSRWAKVFGQLIGGSPSPAGGRGGQDREQHAALNNFPITQNRARPPSWGVNCKRSGILSKNFCIPA
jgi:hypothetical protein